jgi:hypothetical protein
MQQFMAGYIDEAYFPLGVDVDRVFGLGDSEAVEDVEFGSGRRNESNVSPEGSLNFFPDSTNSVRHGNGFIRIYPVFTQAIIDQGFVQCNSGGLVGKGGLPVAESPRLNSRVAP